MKSNTIQLSFTPNSIMTGSATINSNPIPLDQIYGFAIQAVWIGSPTGVIKLQASSDSPGRETQTSSGGPDIITNWVDITNSPYSITGSAGNYMWNFNGAFYRYVRVSYTNTSGTGSLIAEISVKGA